jgi:hypothetical protein
MKIAILAVLAASLAPAFAYPVTANSLKCRSGPGTNYGVKRSYNKGYDIKISCQTPGTSIDGNNLWIKTQHGCYVADRYVKTGTNGYVAKKCSSGGGGGGGGGKTCSAPKVNKATVDLIADFEKFVPNICMFILVLSPGVCPEPLVLWLTHQPRHRCDGPPHRRLRPSLHQVPVLRGQVQDSHVQGQRQEAARR